MNLRTIRQKIQGMSSIGNPFKKTSILQQDTVVKTAPLTILATVLICDSFLFFENESEIRQWAHNIIQEKWPKVYIPPDTRLHSIFGQHTDQYQNLLNMLDLLTHSLQNNKKPLPSYYVQWFEITISDDSHVICATAFRESCFAV